jgi:hypothetical protein
MLGTLQKLLGNDQDYSFLISSEPALFFSFLSAHQFHSVNSQGRAKRKALFRVYTSRRGPPNVDGKKVHSITLMYRSNMSFNLHPQNHVFATLELFKPDI